MLRWRAGLTERVLNARLFKNKTIRCGNWENFPLSDAQLNYAALDAFASLRIYEELMKLPVRPKSETPLPCSLALPFLPPDNCQSPGWVPPAASQAHVRPSKLKVYKLFMGDSSSGSGPMTLAEVATAAGIKVVTVMGYMADAILAGYAYDWNRCDVPEQLLRSIARLVNSFLRSKGAGEQNQNAHDTLEGRQNAGREDGDLETRSSSSLAVVNNILALGPHKERRVKKGSENKGKGEYHDFDSDPLHKLYHSFSRLFGRLGVNGDGGRCFDLRSYLEGIGVGFHDFKEQLSTSITFGHFALALSHLGRMVAKHTEAGQAEKKGDGQETVCSLKECPMPNVMDAALESQSANAVGGVWSCDQTGVDMKRLKTA